MTTIITDSPAYVKGDYDLSAVHEPVKAKEMIVAVLLEEMYDVLI